MILEETVDHLNAAALGISFEAGMPQRDEITKSPVLVSRGFVFLGDEDASANARTTGKPLQLVQVEIVVVLMVANAAGASGTFGAAAMKTAETLKEAVKVTLQGFKHPSAADLTEYEAGRVLGVMNGRLAYQLTFSNITYLGG